MFVQRTYRNTDDRLSETTLPMTYQVQFAGYFQASRGLSRVDVFSFVYFETEVKPEWPGRKPASVPVTVTERDSHWVNLPSITGRRVRQSVSRDNFLGWRQFSSRDGQFGWRLNDSERLNSALELRFLPASRHGWRSVRSSSVIK